MWLGKSQSSILCFFRQGMMCYTCLSSTSSPQGLFLPHSFLNVFVFVFVFVFAGRRQCAFCTSTPPRLFLPHLSGAATHSLSAIFIWSASAISYPYFRPSKTTFMRVLQNQILIENDDENYDDNGDNFDVLWWQCPKIFNYLDFVVKIYPF